MNCQQDHSGATQKSKTSRRTRLWDLCGFSLFSLAAIQILYSFFYRGIYTDVQWEDFFSNQFSLSLLWCVFLLISLSFSLVFSVVSQSVCSTEREHWVESSKCCAVKYSWIFLHFCLVCRLTFHLRGLSHLGRQRRERRRWGRRERH